MNLAERSLAARKLDTSIKLHDQEELSLFKENPNLKVKNITCTDGFLIKAVISPKARDIPELPIPGKIAVLHEKYHAAYGTRNCTGAYYT